MVLYLLGSSDQTAHPIWALLWWSVDWPVWPKWDLWEQVRHSLMEAEVTQAGKTRCSHGEVRSDGSVDLSNPSDIAWTSLCLRKWLQLSIFFDWRFRSVFLLSCHCDQSYPSLREYLIYSTWAPVREENFTVLCLLRDPYDMSSGLMLGWLTHLFWSRYDSLRKITWIDLHILNLWHLLDKCTKFGADHSHIKWAISEGHSCPSCPSPFCNGERSLGQTGWKFSWESSCQTAQMFCQESSGWMEQLINHQNRH